MKTIYSLVAVFAPFFLCTCSGLPLQDPLESFEPQTAVKAVQLQKGPLFKIHGGFYRRPQFSPDGEKLAYILEGVVNGENAENLFILDLKTGRQKAVLNRQDLADWGVASLQRQLFLSWLDNHRYRMWLMRDKNDIVQWVQKIYDTQEGKLVDPIPSPQPEEKQARKEWPPMPFSNFDMAQTIIQENIRPIDGQALGEYLKRAPVVLDPWRFMMLQLPESTGDNTVWLVDYEKKNMQPLLKFSEKFKEARLADGEVIRDKMVFWITHGGQSYLFSYKDQKISELLKIDGEPGRQKAVLNGGKFAYLAFTVNGLQAGNFLYFYDGSNLARMALPATPCDIEFDSQLRNMAISVCGDNERAIWIQPLGLENGNL